jgi:hypothetical protein
MRKGWGMVRRGFTAMAWLAGLAALAYQDVVTPLAQRALGAEVVDERVEGTDWHLDPVGDAFANPTSESCESTAALAEGWRADRT